MGQDVSAHTITQAANDPTPVANHAIHHSSITRRVVLGAFLGLAWGASLRAWMVVLALEFGERPQFTWEGTFAAILLPAALMGAVLGGAAYAAETSGRKGWGWAILLPLLLVLGPAIVTDDFISTLVTTGLGGGAIGVALIGLLGGYALSGFGPQWLRWVSGLLTLFLTIAAVYAFFFADRAAAVPPSVGEVFGVLLFVLLMALLVAGVSAPSRYWSGQHASR